jgi:O-antigen/teichoic acid export membrane protein
MRNLNDKIKSRPIFQKVLKSLAYLSSEKIIKIGTGLFVHAWVARYLTPLGYGKLGYVINFVALFIPFISLGTDDVVIKRLVEDKNNGERVINEVFSLRLMGAIFGILVLQVFNFFLLFRTNIELFSYVAGYGFLLVVNIFYTFEQPFVSKINMRIVFLGRTIGYVSGATLRIVGILTGMRLVYFFISYFLEEVISRTFIFLQYLRKQSFKPNLSLNHYKKEILQLCWPLFLVKFFMAFEQRIPFLFLQKFSDAKTLGFFSVSFTLIDLWTFVPISLCTSTFPILIKNKNENQQLYQERSIYLLHSCIWLGLGVVAGTNLFSDYIINTLYGRNYIGADTVLNIVSYIALISFYNIARVKIFTIDGRIKLWSLISGSSLVINTVTLWVFKNQITIDVIIWSLVFSHLVANAIFSIYDSYARKNFYAFFTSVIFPIRILKKIY